MDTSLDCMPCFMKMAVNEARLACPDDVALQHTIVKQWGSLLGTLDFTQPPPAIARRLSRLVQDLTGCGDLYAEDKKNANAWVLSLLPEVRERIAAEAADSGGDPLGLALELSIIGNYIDRGVDLEFDLEGEIAALEGAVSRDALDEFRQLAAPGATVLILGDNTGEIVLDTLLVEQLKRRGCTVTYAVRSAPVLNDATMKDAELVGMTGLCRVVESGVDTPGTVLECCTPEFLARMREADVILGKGQGNFEALSGRWPGIFCAFKVKCSRVAAETGLDVGCSAFCRMHAEGSDHD
ncbi:MAG: DUF89 family protein [Desulfovibrionaceae bacterium]|nr:DUF89 family protein [Desulfovibrionaceae bacterium]